MSSTEWESCTRVSSMWIMMTDSSLEKESCTRVSSVEGESCAQVSRMGEESCVQAVMAKFNMEKKPCTRTVWCPEFVLSFEYFEEEKKKSELNT